MKAIKESWPEIKFVFLVFLIWRIFTLALGGLSFGLLTFKASFPYIDEMLISSGFPQWVWHWGNFDGVHYLDLARNGYHGSGLQVFFPLYPIAINLITGMAQNAFASAFLISNVFAFLSAVVLYKLVAKETNSTSAAKWAVIFLFSFPTSFFLGSIYTESLFLFLMLMSFYLPSPYFGLFGALASATRLVGIFIPVALFFRRKRSIAIALASAGLFSYVAYLWWKFSNPFYFLSAQAAFKNERAHSLTSLITPPQVFVRYIKIFLTANPVHYDFLVAAVEFLAFTLGALFLAYLIWNKKLARHYLIFYFFALVLPTFSGTFSSMPRYLLTIFPIFMALASIKSLKVKSGIFVVFAILLSVFTVLFVRGYWIS